MSTIVNFFLFLAAFWGLPSDEHNDMSWKRVGSDIDWTGAMTLSTAFGLLSYVLAMIAANYSSLGDAQNIALLTISLLLVPALHRRPHRHRNRPPRLQNPRPPPRIPNRRHLSHRLNTYGDNKPHLHILDLRLLRNAAECYQSIYAVHSVEFDNHERLSAE